MNKIKENILDVLLRKKTDPIYSDMVEDLKNKGYSFEDDPYFVLTFHTQIGSLYKRGGIAFYGRATNGWDDDYNNGISSILTHRNSRFFQMVKRITNLSILKLLLKILFGVIFVKWPQNEEIQIIPCGKTSITSQ